MTNQNPTSGNATGLRDAHGDSIILTGLAEALDFLMNEDRCGEGQVALSRAILEKSSNLSSNLEKILFGRGDSK